MKTIRRLAPLTVSVVLVLAMGGVSIAVSASANRKARSIHIADREKLNETLAGLTNQYLRFAFKEAADYASEARWTFQPGDPTDRVLLETFARRSALLNHGAMLLTLDGTPVNVFANPPGLPEADDPGFGPMRRMLAEGGPGLSSLMNVDGTPMVALAVPAMQAGAPRALFVAFFRPDQSPLQVYTQGLDHGVGAIGEIVDSGGTVVTSSDPARIGERVAAPARDALGAGEAGFLEFDADRETMTAAVHPIGLGGWGDVITQPASEFFGPIRSGGFQVLLALISLLLVAAAGLAILNHFRQRALRTAYEYKGQLLANTTHELKTPLTAIRGAATTLTERWRELPGDTVEQLIAMIHRRSDCLAKLVDRILMGARLDAGRELQMRPGPVEVRRLLGRLAADFADTTPHHSFVVDAPDGVRAHVDPEALDQVVGMLLENAVKYSPEGGPIKLKADARGDQVVIRVVDHGIGISPEDQRHIFEPYYRANRGDDQRYGGVGLGLAIVRHLVESNDGRISVASEPGRGTVFSLVLPRAEDAATGPEGSAQRLRLAGWVPVRVAAKAAGVHPSTVRAWARQGLVRSETVQRSGGKRYLVSVEDLRRSGRIPTGAAAPNGDGSPAKVGAVRTAS